MKYYVITMLFGDIKVVWTGDRIDPVRNFVKREMSFNLEVWGYSEGFAIVTDTSEKEYWYVKNDNITLDKMSYLPKTEVRSDHAAALEVYKSGR